MSIGAGSRQKTFIALEASYGATATLQAANYVRAKGGNITHAPFGYVESPERVGGDDVVDSFRRRSATSGTLTTLIRGAPNGHDAPDNDALWRGAFGRAPVEVDAEADTTSGDGLGRVLGVVSGGAQGTGLLYPVIGKAGTATPTITVPGDIEYNSRNYHLAATLPSLTMRTEPTDAGSSAGTGPGTPGPPPQLASGWTVSEAALTIRGTEEAECAFSGPARTAAQGSEVTPATLEPPPATGEEDLVPQGIDDAKLWISDLSQSSPTWTEVTAGLRSMSITLANNLAARNDESGSALARSVYRTSRRTISVELMCYAEQQNELWSAIHAARATGPYTAVVFSWGTKEGARAMVYLPRVRFGLPSPDAAEDAQGFTFAGMAMGTGQDAFTLCLG